MWHAPCFNNHFSGEPGLASWGASGQRWLLSLFANVSVDREMKSTVWQGGCSMSSGRWSSLGQVFMFTTDSVKEFDFNIYPQVPICSADLQLYDSDWRNANTESFQWQCRVMHDIEINKLSDKCNKHAGRYVVLHFVCGLFLAIQAFLYCHQLLCQMEFSWLLFLPDTIHWHPGLPVLPRQVSQGVSGLCLAEITTS